MPHQTDKPVLLYCGRQNASDADFTRQVSLVIHLVGHFRVVLMIPPKHVARFPLLSGIEFLDEPEITLLHGTSRPARESGDRIQATINRYAELDPSVVVIEDYPFEPSTDARLRVVLACSAGAARPPLMLCSLLDPMCPLAFSHADQERIARVLNSRFQAVLVHSDPSFARLEEHFRAAALVRVPIHHCGFISLAAGKVPLEREPRVLVHLGSKGREQLLRAVTEAQQLLWSSARIGMTIGGQPSDEAGWRWLSSFTAGASNLLLQPVSDHEIGLEMMRSACVVCPCSYHHVSEVLSSRTPALFVLDTDEANVVEQKRALRLRRFGATAQADIRYLNGPTLASHLRRLSRLRPPASALEFAGAVTGADLVRELADRWKSGRDPAFGGH